MIWDSVGRLGVACSFKGFPGHCHVVSVHKVVSCRKELVKERNKRKAEHAVRKFTFSFSEKLSR
jgi:hypothetical protein